MLFHMKVLCALWSFVCILYFVALYNSKPEACPVFSGNNMDSVHRNSYGIVKAVHITTGLYEGAEPRKSAAVFNPLHAELNPICYLLALLAHHFLHVSRIRVKSLNLRLLMSYIYIYIYTWSTYS